MIITYVYGRNLYVNTTNRCTCACEFCLRASGDGVGTGTNLWLEREPTVDEIVADVLSRDLTRYDELVFCGYGEPTFRWDDIAAAIDRIRAAREGVHIRMDTNGHGSHINGRDITPELAGRIDKVSISLNRADAADYDAIVHPDFAGAFDAMCTFTRGCVAAGVDTVMTVVDNMPAEEIERCRAVCEGLGARFRVRHYQTDWSE